MERREAKLLFVWSQMIVSDELKRRKRATALAFFDFVEVGLAHPTLDCCCCLLSVEVGLELSVALASRCSSWLALDAACPAMKTLASLLTVNQGQG